MKGLSPWGLAVRGTRVPEAPAACVLVVDDDPAKRLAMRAVLEPLHLQIIEADSGLSALRCVMDRDFAVILLDVRMPDIDGFETAALIRRRRQSEMTPIIFITAYTSDEISSKARYVEGAVDFMAPPVSPDELRAKVSVFVNLYLHAVRLATETRSVQDSADQLGVLTDAAPVGIFRTDGDNKFTYTNPRWSAITGFPAEQAVGSDWDTLLASREPPGRIIEKSEILADTAELGSRYRIWLSDSASRVVLAASEPLTADDGEVTGWVGTLADVTAGADAEVERSRMEEKLRQREQLFRGAFDASQTGIALSAADGETYIDVNPALCEMLGYTKAELLELNWKLITHPDDLERNVKEFAKLVEGREDVDYVEKRYLTKQGDTLWIKISDAVIRGPDGSPRYFVTHINNVTERREAARQKQGLETQLIQAQKMEAIGQLAGGIAHDFNNILSVILNYAQFAADDLDPTDPRLADIQEISKAGEKAAHLVHQLLSFSRKEIVEKREIDLNEVVTGIYSILSRALGEDITLNFVQADKLPSVHADAGRIEQVLLNLAVNARDAMPDGGVLEITTSTATMADGEVPLLRGGDYVVTTLCDTGTGIEEATLVRIFEPFFTTKPRGEGTGMGLSSAYGIIEQAGGCLRVESEVGVGTTFSIYLPIKEGSATEDAKHPSGIETILLVEDEDAVRKLVSRILRKQGYDVIPCSSGRQALDYIRMNASTVDLLLTDVVMPKMSGKELSDKATAISSELKTLFMSGYTDALIAQRGVLAADEELLEKPFGPDALLASVRSMLDTAAAA